MISKTKLGKPKTRPPFLKGRLIKLQEAREKAYVKRILHALRMELSENWGVPCVKHIKDLAFDCIVCRLTLALHILDDAYAFIYDEGYAQTKKDMSKV